MSRKERPAPTFGLVLIRVVVGSILLARGWKWIQGSGFDGRLVRRTVEASLADIPRVLAWWGEHVILINPDAFAFLWRWGALACGLLLFLGALTRPAGWLAVGFLTHAYVFGPDQHKLAFVLLLVSCLACALSRAGRRAGLDTMFDEHFPGWVTWTKSTSSFLP